MLTKYFGKTIAIVVFTVVLMLNLKGFSASSYKKMADLHIIYYLIVVVVFFSMLYFFYQNSKITFKILYIFLIIITQLYVISSIATYVEVQNKSSSLLEKKAAISLSGYISVPIALFLVLTLGIIFDYIKLQHIKRKQSYKS